MERSSVTSAAVCSFWAEMDFGTASCNEGVPLGRTAAVMLRRFWVGMPVMVTIWLGVGGAKPPVMPAVVRHDHERVVIGCSGSEEAYLPGGGGRTRGSTWLGMRVRGRSGGVCASGECARGSRVWTGGERGGGESSAL